MILQKMINNYLINELFVDNDPVMVLCNVTALKCVYKVKKRDTSLFIANTLSIDIHYIQDECASIITDIRKSEKQMSIDKEEISHELKTLKKLFKYIYNQKTTISSIKAC